MAKILIVEDNEMNRDMLARRLQRLGYDVLDGGQSTRCPWLRAVEAVAAAGLVMIRA